MRRFCCCGLIPFSLFETTLVSKTASGNSSALWLPFHNLPDHQAHACVRGSERGLSDVHLPDDPRTKRCVQRSFCGGGLTLVPVSFIWHAEPTGMGHACQVFFPRCSRQVKSKGPVTTAKITDTVSQYKSPSRKYVGNALFLVK